MADTFLYDVFLSHNSKDKPLVESLADKLIKEGINPFLDIWNLIPGAPWIPELEDALKDSATFAVFVGPYGIKSWEDREMQSALMIQTKDKNRRVIPVLLPGAQQPSDNDLPLFLQQHTWVDFRSSIGNEEAFKRLVAGIRGNQPGRPTRGLSIPTRNQLPPPGILPKGSRLEVLFRNPTFTGRQEQLLTIAEKLLHNPSEASLVIQVVNGIGGVGKTQLATEFCYRYGRYFAGVHWLTVHQPDFFERELAACGKKMEISNWSENDQNSQVEATLKAWREHGPRLVVLDDLNDLGSVRDMLGKLKDGGDIRVLITSRNPNWSPDLAGKSLELDVLKKEESIDFLRQLLTNESKWSNSALATLAERLGKLPLPLWLAGQYLRSYKMLSIEEYVKRLDNVFDDEAMTGWQKEQGNPTQHEMNLRETFLVSWKSLGMKISSRVFLIASYFSPNVVIPTETLYYACLVDGTNLTTKIATLEKIGFFDDIEFDSLVKILESVLGISQSDIRSHVNYDGKLTRDESSRMIAIIMVGLGFGQIHAEFYGDNIFTDFESLRAEYELQEDGFPKLFIELENVGLISIREKQNQEETDGVVLHPIISEFGRTFNVRFALLSIFLSIYRELTQDDEFPLMSRTRKLADHIEWIAKIGEEHNMFFAGIFWNRLGTLLRANGKFYESIPVFEKALKSFQKFFGTENSHVMAVISNLAGSYADLGDLSKASELYGKVKDFEPENERERAAKITNEGHMLIDEGELNQALEKYKLAYEIDKKHFGEIHHEVGNDASNLGNLLRRMKDYDGAIKYLEEALNILEQTDVKDHPLIAIAAQNLALAQEDIGNYEKALELFLRAKDIFSNQLGEEHQNLAVVCGNLAHCYSSLERNDDADEMYQLSISILEKDLDNNNIYLTPSYQEYGKFLLKVNNTQKGFGYLVRSLDLEKSIHGQEFEQTSSRPASILEFITLSNMQLIQFERYKEVERRSTQLLDLLEQHNLDHTVFYGCVLQQYSLSLGLQGKYARALELLEKALTVLKELLPPDHVFVQGVELLIEKFGGQKPSTQR